MYQTRYPVAPWIPAHRNVTGDPTSASRAGDSSATWALAGGHSGVLAETKMAELLRAGGQLPRTDSTNHSTRTPAPTLSVQLLVLRTVALTFEGAAPFFPM